MPDIFKPEDFIKLVFSSNFFKGKLLTNDLQLKTLELQAILKATGISKREVDATVYKVIDIYENKMQDLKKAGVRAFKKEALNGEALLKNRLEGLVLYNEVQKIKEENQGKFYRWLPSSSKEPDPEHQLLYGKIFKIGEGDKNGNMPAERYGMAFSEEQEAQILDMMGKMGDFLSKQGEAKEPENKEPEKKDEGLLNEAKKNMADQSNQKEAQAELERAMGFNMSIEKFAEDFKAILPSSAKSIVETAKNKEYDSSIAKANDIRKALLDAYLEVQANIDGLPESMRSKANTYKALTEDAKLAKSGSFWEIVEIGAEMAKARAKANAISKANGNANGGDESAFRSRFLALGDKYKRKE